jgi:hypothetical protein
LLRRVSGYSCRLPSSRASNRLGTLGPPVPVLSLNGDSAGSDVWPFSSGRVPLSRTRGGSSGGLWSGADSLKSSPGRRGLAGREDPGAMHSFNPFKQSLVSSRSRCSGRAQVGFFVQGPRRQVVSSKNLGGNLRVPPRAYGIEPRVKNSPRGGRPESCGRSRYGRSRRSCRGGANRPSRMRRTASILPSWSPRPGR